MQFPSLCLIHSFRTSDRNVAIIISELGFPMCKGTNPYSEISGTFDLSEVGVFITVVDSIQFELLSVMFSWYNEYLLRILYNISREYLILFCTN